MGVKVIGIPDPIFVNYLDHAKADAKTIGAMFEPNMETLANLAPDLILSSWPTQIEELSKIAPTIDMVAWGEGHIDNVLKMLEGFGKITGKEAEATKLAADLNGKIAATKAAIAGKGNALIVMTNGPKVSAYAGGSRFGWLHDYLALPEAVTAVAIKDHGDAISFEFIANANPDWLIVIDRGAAIGDEGQSAKQTLDNELVAGTTAWKKGQVIYLNSANIYIAGGGYQSISITLDKLAAAFNASK